MGLTASGKALCYINNFGNEENSAGGTDYPCIVLDRSQSVQSYDHKYYVRRSYIDPSFVTSRNAFNCTNYKNLIDSIIAIPTSNGGEYTDLTNQIKITEGSYNKESNNSSYANPIILHATVTIKNNSSGSITYDGIKLQAKNTLSEDLDVNYNRRWANPGNHYRVELASVSITPITLAPGDIGTFTIIVG